MQSGTKTQSEPPSRRAKNHAIQQRIPWWQDISAQVYAELQLPPVDEAELQSVDVVIIGAGVAGLSAALAIKERDASIGVLVQAGLRAELWTPAQVSEATQGRLDTKTVVSAMWLPDEGRIQPLTLLAHLARRALWQSRCSEER